MPAKDFLDNKHLASDRAHFTAIFRMVADTGVEQAMSKRKFRKERTFYGAKKNNCKGGPKSKKMVRVVCFRHGNIFVAMFAFWKSGSAWPESVFTKANKLKAEMLQHKSLKS